MRFTNVTKASSTHAYVPLFFNTASSGLESLLVYFNVGLDQNGDPMVAIVDTSTNEPLMWYSLVTDGGGHRIQFGSDMDALFKQWDSMPSATRAALPFERYCDALAACFHTGDMVKYGDSIDSEYRFRQTALGFLPPSASMYEDSDFCTRKAKELRDIVNALGLSPASIKREDCAAAILQARQQYESMDSLITGFVVGVVVENDKNGTIRLTKCPEGEWVPKFFSADEIDDYFPLLNRQDYSPSFGSITESSAIKRALDTSQRLSKAGIPVEPLYMAVQILQGQSWFANQQVGSLREEIARLDEAMRKNDEQTRKMIAAMSAASTVTVPTGKGTVEIMGTEFPYFAHPDAPSAIANYSLDFWSAKIQLGGGADHVEFDARDFAGVVLHDHVSSLVGAPGVGKTTICVQIAHALGIPCFIVQFTRDKPIESLIGVDKIRNGQQVFVDGEITVAMRAAAADPDTPHMIVFDEFDHAPSEVQSDFHGVVEGRDYTLPSGEVIKNHGNLRFVLTRNTSGHGDQTGRHASANISDSAFNSRIRSAMIVQYMKPEQECVLLCTHGLDSDEADQVVSFANATRRSVDSMDSGESFDGMTEPVCLRHLLGYAHARRRGVPKRKALAMCILAHLPQGDRRVANEMIVSHISLGN